MADYDPGVALKLQTNQQNPLQNMEQLARAQMMQRAANSNAYNSASNAAFPTETTYRG